MPCSARCRATWRRFSSGWRTTTPPAAPWTHCALTPSRPQLAAAPVGEQTFDECSQNSAVLADCGTAPELTGIVDWLNTPSDAPLSLAGLQAEGRVVLVDFWTYSCINCQRTLPYITAWDAAYRDQGLTVIGVHSPEFAFEHEVANVAERAKDFGVEYPIAIDNDFRTWRAYDQRFWPAHYLIDRSGTVRQVHYGEGAYKETEALIRELLAEEGAPVAQSAVTPGTQEANQAQTPRPTSASPEPGATPTRSPRTGLPSTPPIRLRRGQPTESRSAAPGPSATSRRRLARTPD